MSSFKDKKVVHRTHLQETFRTGTITTLLIYRTYIVSGE